MSVYEIQAPDGRTFRVEHASLETLKAGIMPGYTVLGQVFGANRDLSGGHDQAAMDEMVAYIKVRLERDAE